MLPDNRSMDDIKHLIKSLRHLGPEAIRVEIVSREAEIKALRILMRASRQAVCEKQVATSGGSIK